MPYVSCLRSLLKKLWASMGMHQAFIEPWNNIKPCIPDEPAISTHNPAVNLNVQTGCLWSQTSKALLAPIQPYFSLQSLPWTIPLVPYY